MADRISLEQLHANIESLNTETTRKLLYIDESLVDRPETTRAYIERIHQWARLLEVVSSVPQLVGQENTVPLVGFLGHFSSGKSTLINALLEIGPDEHPSYKRPTGEQPTDKGITLTTHYDQFDAARHQFPPSLGQIVVNQGPSFPMLEHMTLVDTPGLGDNPAEMDIVIQFLHLVHVLVLPIHGRQPFADSAKAFALLNLAFKDLAGVPKIFVVTNADHFLTDRRLLSNRRREFHSDWNQAAADKFWQETLARLQGDARFHAHRETLTAAEPVFVDSEEGFQVDLLRNKLLPIVQDSAQRARTDAARAGYVFRSAAAALRHLETYISERSRHLAALRRQAEKRSQTTETAIELLIADLGTRLNATLQRLPVNPQQLATLNDPLNQIVNVQTIQQAFDVNRYQSQFQTELQACAQLQFKHVVSRAVATYDQRRDDPQAVFRSHVLTEDDVERVINKSGLYRAMKKCARSVARNVLSQYRGHLQSGLDVLGSRSDSFRLSDVLRDYKDDLERFERKHDDSIKSLFAYVTQPDSIELLREHGFVAFDADGKRRIDPENIDVFGLEDYVRLEDAIEGCKKSLREDHRLIADSTELPDRIDTATDAGDDVVEEVSGSAFERTSLLPVFAHVAQQVASAVTTFDSKVQAEIDKLLEAVRASERAKEARIESISAARKEIAGRLFIVFLLLGGSAYALNRYQPEMLTRLWGALPKSIAQEVMVNVITTLIAAVPVGLLAFVWIGFSNPAVKTAVSSITRLRLGTWWQRRKQRRQLHRIGKTSLQSLPSPLNQLDTACLSAMTQWIQNDNAEFTELHGDLADARQRVNHRAQTIGRLVNTITPWVTNLPKQLQARSLFIREAAITEHMATIRDAADSVETLRADIARIAENAEASAP